MSEAPSRNLRITDWPEDERPREKLMRYGAETLTNAELVAILLGKGTTTYNALDTARMLLRAFDSLETLASASYIEMQKVPGIGPVKAVTLLAAFQLFRNLQSQQAGREIIRFTDPSSVAGIYMPLLGHRKKESFYMVMLNAAMQKIADLEISRGTLTASLVHPREVFKEAIRHSASGIIVLHNHPSGVLQPSEQDKRITEKLVRAGELLEIPVHDHLIITTGGYYSFREHNLIS